MSATQRKPFHFVGSSLKDLRSMPEDVKELIRSRLRAAEQHHGSTYGTEE